jgi:hypothetical protein
MKTAVEWLFKWMIDNKDLIIEERLQAFEKAKEMEKEQAQKYAEFAIHCDRNDFPILEFDAYMNLETFKSE